MVDDDAGGEDATGQEEGAPNVVTAPISQAVRDEIEAAGDQPLPLRPEDETLVLDEVGSGELDGEGSDA